MIGNLIVRQSNHVAESGPSAGGWASTLLTSPIQRGQLPRFEHYLAGFPAVRGAVQIPDGGFFMPGDWALQAMGARAAGTRYGGQGSTELVGGWDTM